MIQPEGRPPVTDTQPNSAPTTYQFTPNQAQAIGILLPKGYSLQIERKAVKRLSAQITTPPQVTATTLLSKRTSSKPLPSEDIYDYGTSAIPLPKRASKPLSKTDREIEEIDQSIKAKYNAIVLNKEPSRQVPSVDLDESLRPCLKILNMLKNYKHSWPFREPVDPIRMGIPHYMDIVKEPMDLQTIEANLLEGKYATLTQFHADVNKIIQNSLLFNANSIEYTTITTDFERYYRKITKDPTADDSIEMEQNRHMHGLDAQPKEPKLTSKPSAKSKPVSKASNPGTVSLAERKELIANIRRMPKEYAKGVRQIAMEGDLSQNGELDVISLPADKIRILQTYVGAKLALLESGAAYPVSQPNKDQESSFDMDDDDES